MASFSSGFVCLFVFFYVETTDELTIILMSSFGEKFSRRLRPQKYALERLLYSIKFNHLRHFC